jgi:4-hydroxy-tetrahydrodipicolinate synthase
MNLGGLSVPTPTLFGTDGQIDTAKNARFTRSLCDAQVDHIFVLGTLGEFPLVASEERGPLLEAVIESLTWKTDGWVGCGAPATAQAVAHARAAEEAGAAALVIVPPFFLRPTDASIKHYYREVRRATELPLLAYNIPAHVGYALSPVLVHELAREKVLAGIKDTSGSIESVRAFVQGAPEGFAVMPGDDDLARESIQLGATGAVMGAANLVPKLPVQLVRAAIKGDHDEAQRLQKPLEALVRVMRSGPFPSTIKYLAHHLRKQEVGYRSPYEPLTPDEEARVTAELGRVEPDLRPFL